MHDEEKNPVRAAAEQLGALAHRVLLRNEPRAEEPTYISSLLLLLYCAYVSENRVLLRIDDFDERYAVGSVADHLGTSYLVRDFVSYYGSLKADGASLARFDYDSFEGAVLARCLPAWSQALARADVSFADEEGFALAARLGDVCAMMVESLPVTRHLLAYRSSGSLADLVVSLADVEDARVLDFTCGYGSFLGRAAAAGASEVCGCDINAQAAGVASIARFFGNAACRAHIVRADALDVDAVFPQAFDRVIVAPAIVPFKGLDHDMTARALPRGLYEGPLSSFEEFCAVRALTKLAEGGRAVVQLPYGFSFRTHANFAALRKFFVESGCLRAAIEIPGGAYAESGVMSLLLVLDKGAAYRDVLLVDLTSEEMGKAGLFEKNRCGLAFTEKGVRFIADLVSSRSERDRVSMLVGADDLARHDYTLCYAQYGETVDIEGMLSSARSVDDIVSDIAVAYGCLEAMTDDIDSLLASFE